jgi:Tol biopolymer transport system component
MKGKVHLIISLGLLFLMLAWGICWSQTTERVSVDSAGVEGDLPSVFPSISANGRYVAFESVATNLLGAGNDTNGRPDIFVRDRQAPTTIRVSIHSNGTTEGDNRSNSPSISGDGRHVAFESWATNLVATGGDAFPDIYVHDRDADGNGTYDDPAPGGISTVRVSVDSDGNEQVGESLAPSISGDGRYVAFQSNADLVVTDTNGFTDIYVHDRDADGDGIYDEPGAISTIRVSVASGGGEATGDSNSPSISADGRYVAFDSDAADLVGLDNNGKFDIFVHDRDADGNGTYDDPAPGGISTVRVSVDSSGSQGNGHSYSPSISGDGRYVAFYSEANNLVGSDSNASTDVFVHDRDADGDGIYDEPGAISTIRVSVASGGGEATGDSNSPSISADGRYGAFDSDAADLVGSDNNGISDIFVYEREDLPPTVDSTSPAHNANGVGVGSSITATFSKPMNGSTIDTNTFTLNDGVTGKVTYDANSTTARFTPTSKLAYDTTYTATITTAAEDLAGSPMQTDYTWSFTTESEKNNSSVSISCFIATAASDWADF